VAVSSAAEEDLTPIKRALVEIRRLRARIARIDAERQEPIAMIGMGFRLPGSIRDADGLERLLWSKIDAVTEIPGDRWSLDALYASDPEAPGKMTTRCGAFLAGVDQFDADFFGISPREAASMDPQQRLLLEVSWEAFENAGHAPDSVAGTRTGVYLGIANSDYGRTLLTNREIIDAYASTGNAYSVAAGRLSYFFGLQGPSIAVDTACSSSLVALHLACQGLRLKECDLAIVGGVNLILTPEMNIIFSKARMMAADGRCKAFDVAADGYVRGEGCAVVVLRRLSDALSDNDRVLALVRGSAVNQDGRSGGLTAPNGPAQEAVIRAALAAADVEASSVGYVESHGTGTALGDPIEVGALGAVYGTARNPHTPLLIGSIKTNIGHLEAAAGLAGLLKVVLSLNRGEIPPSLHFNRGNPHIDWAGLPIDVPTDVTPWKRSNARRFAGVSSFGFSGTNAHAILEEAPDTHSAVTEAPDRPLHILALSARDDASLADLARVYEERLTTKADVADVCFTANAGRSHFNHRVAVIGASAEDFRRGLSDFGATVPNQNLATGFADGSSRPQVAFLFTGQGAQYAGMGRVLYDTSPVFRQTLDECAAAIAPYLDRGLLQIMFAPDADESAAINDTVYAQPVTFALEIALAALWRSYGIEPVAVLGHSLGEYAAAQTAGVMTLADSLRLVAERGRLTRDLALQGAMAAVFGPHSAVAAEVALADGEIEIAAYNGPENFVLSGTRPALEQALDRLTSGGIKTKPLRISYAAHSRSVDPVLPTLQKVLHTVPWSPPRITLISNVSGAPAGREELSNSDYWLRQMRAPVRYSQSIKALQKCGVTHFVEIGPHPVLLGMGAECIPDSAVEWLPSLRRDRADWTDLLESLQRLYVSGAQIDWGGFDRGYVRHRLPLPTYPFRRRRHWLEPARREIAVASPWSEMSNAAERQSWQGPIDLNASSYPAKWECLTRLATAHAIHILREANLFLTAGKRHRLAEIFDRAGIQQSYQHVVQRWLDNLVMAGTLHVDDEAYEAPVPLAELDLAALWRQAEVLFADNKPLLAYVRHCTDLLGSVVRGAVSPIETLFPGGGFEIAENLYERSATMRYINAVAAAALEALVRCTPAGRKVRILEVGAGTGGTTAAVLPRLAADRTSYCFTDVSDVFLYRARDRFAAYPFVSFAPLDVDRDFAEQGYAGASFDVIVSANAIHASTNLRNSLQRLRELLAPGGVLILIESTTHFAWFDITTGLIEGWRHFADDLRNNSPLLGRDQWIEALSASGFEAALAWPASGSPAEHLGQHVLSARVPGTFAAASDVSVDARDVSPPATVLAETMNAGTFRQRAIDALPAERSDLLREFVREKVMQILRLDASAPLSRNSRLMDLGMDSLMAVQLRNAIVVGLGLQRPLPASLMFDYPTIDSIASYLVVQLVPVDIENRVRSQQSAPISADVAAMTDAEVETLLLKKLGEPR
jgi:acyl transferase domain-containing protein/phospholipid N-methyltransferase